MHPLAIAFAATLVAAGPATTPTRLPPNAVGCETRHDVWDFANARDNHDAARQHQLFRGACDQLGGETYKIISDQDGLARIRIFPTHDWNHSRLVYTLDEMLQTP
jgi:hypothetical protein